LLPVLVALGQEDAVAQEPGQEEADRARLPEVVVLGDQDLGERLGRRYDEALLVERPPVAEEAVVLDGVEP